MFRAAPAIATRALLGPTLIFSTSFVRVRSNGRQHEVERSLVAFQLLFADGNTYHATWCRPFRIARMLSGAAGARSKRSFARFTRSAGARWKRITRVEVRRTPAAPRIQRQRAPFPLASVETAAYAIVGKIVISKLGPVLFSCRAPMLLSRALTYLLLASVGAGLLGCSSVRSTQPTVAIAIVMADGGQPPPSIIAEIHRALQPYIAAHGYACAAI
jgi:hypothetical protein